MRMTFSLSIRWMAALGIGLYVSGCIVVGDNVQSVFTMGRKEAERTETLSHPLPDRRTLTIDGGYGSIAVAGSETRECRVEVKVEVRGNSASQARQILKQVTVHLDETATGLRLYLEKPLLVKGISVGASFVVLVPRHTGLDCRTSFGKIEIQDITGDVKASTRFAGIRCTRIEGALELETKHGDIECDEILSMEVTLRSSYGNLDLKCLDLASFQKPGSATLETEHGKIVVENLAARQIKARSSYGNIDIHCVPAEVADVAADLETSYGSIDFDTPSKFGGRVHMTTTHGSVSTLLPVTPLGKASSTRLVGQIGEGRGDLRMSTSFGSIVLR